MSRLFVALPLLDPARAPAEALLTRLRQEVDHQAVRWVRPEKLHLTLKFLGSIEDPEGVETALARALAGRRSLALRLTGLGGFPNLDRPKTVWLGVAASEPLTSLQADVEGRLRDRFPLESRSFTPHVTLGRVNPGSPKVGRAVARIAEETGPIEATWTADRVELIDSLLDGRHEVVRAFPLD